MLAAFRGVLQSDIAMRECASAISRGSGLGKASGRMELLTSSISSMRLHIKTNQSRIRQQFISIVNYQTTRSTITQQFISDNTIHNKAMFGRAPDSHFPDSAPDSLRIHFSENLELSVKSVWLVGWLPKPYEGD